MLPIEYFYFFIIAMISLIVADGIKVTCIYIYEKYKNIAIKDYKIAMEDIRHKIAMEEMRHRNERQSDK